jgi:hypothetical protein
VISGWEWFDVDVPDSLAAALSRNRMVDTRKGFFTKAIDSVKEL